MVDYMEIGSTPAEEPCAQVDSDDYSEKALEECRRWKAQLLKKFGEPPAGCFLKTKWFNHDFGSYCEVVVGFDDEIPGSLDWALNVEGHLPGSWE